LWGNCGGLEAYTITACELADNTIKEFLASGNKVATYYCRHTGKPLFQLKKN